MLLLDQSAAVTLIWPFMLVPALLATFMILLAWRLTKKASFLGYVPIFLLLLLTLHILELSPVKPFKRFYYSLDAGVTQAEVTYNLEKYFPRNGKYQQPSFSPNNDRVWFALDPDDGRYNSEIIEVIFKNGRIESTRYYPD